MLPFPVPLAIAPYPEPCSARFELCLLSRIIKRFGVPRPPRRSPCDKLRHLEFLYGRGTKAKKCSAAAPVDRTSSKRNNLVGASSYPSTATMQAWCTAPPQILPTKSAISLRPAQSTGANAGLVDGQEGLRALWSARYRDPNAVEIDGIAITCRCSLSPF